MAGLVPAIHALFVSRRKAWMPATSAGMTNFDSVHVGNALAGTGAIPGQFGE